MKLTLDLEQETDERWIAEVPELPGVLAYGKTADQAVAAARALALRVSADQIEAGDFEFGAWQPGGFSPGNPER